MKRTKVTVFPTKFQIEPIDVGGFDCWQDWEGLQDASKACRAAWKDFVGEWRADRDDALVTQQPKDQNGECVTPADLSNIRAAKRLGAAFGLCAALGRLPELTAAEKAAYWRWRARVLRADPVAWQMFWAADGAMSIAARFEKTEREVIAARVIVARWLSEELYTATPIVAVSTYK